MSSAARNAKPVGATWPVFEDGAPATLIGNLARNAAQFGRTVAFRERDLGIWQEWNWQQVYDDVLAMAAGFEALGLTAGSAVTIVGDNRKLQR